MSDSLIGICESYFHTHKNEMFYQGIASITFKFLLKCQAGPITWTQFRASTSITGMFVCLY